MNEATKISAAAREINEKRNADVLIFLGPIDRPHDEALLDMTASRKRRDNVWFFITTYGGDADAAFRIARCLQRTYKHVTAVVSGTCKSAGTLLVLGAHNLVMFDHAELGPLDVQISKEDALGERSSGLVPTQAFEFLDSQVRYAVAQSIVDFKMQLLLTTRTATDLASRLVGTLYGGIYAQVDPMRLGELQRAQAVATQYGKRLIEASKIADQASLAQLVSGYPSHGFVIDREEAQKLFPKKVRTPEADEIAVAESLFLRGPVDSLREPIILYIDEERKSDEEAVDKDQPDERKESPDLAGTSEGDRDPGEAC